MSTRHPSFHQSGIGVRSPDSNQSHTHRHIYRSADRFHGRSVPSTNPLDLPNVDSNARYSISYVPGMSEHVVKTGKTLSEAQLKVVIFACEVERLNTLNYNLVKENEILKAQGVKPEREKDLETKLAIVLAENEKLIQVVDELHDVFQRQRGSLASGQKEYPHEDYERRIADLVDALDDWKQRYQDLEQAQNMEGQVNTVGLQAAMRDLERERDLLADRLARQDRDLEAVRARLSSYETRGPGLELQGDFQQRMNELMMENERVNRELEIMKLKYGDANTLQLKLKEYDDKIKTLLNENDKLNRILNEKMRELQALRNTVPMQQGSPQAFRDITAQNTERGEDRIKRTGHGLGASQGIENVAGLQRENTDLRAENERLNNALRQMQRSPSRGPEGEVRIPAVPAQNLSLSGFGSVGGRSEIDALREKLLIISKENERLNQVLAENLAGHHRPEGEPDVLRERLELLLKENERLNQLLGDKVREIEELKSYLKDVPGGNVRVEQLNQQIAALIGENRRLSEQLGERSREIENLKRALGVAGVNVGNLEGLQEKIILVSGENERLHRVLEDRNREIEQMRRTIEEIRSGNGRTEQLTRQINDLLNENARLNDLLMEKTRENENLRREHSTINVPQAPQNNQLLIITAERDRLGRLLDERARETDALRRQNEELRAGAAGGSPQLSSQVNSLLSENKRLNDLVVERVREIEGLRRRVTELEANQALRTSSHYDPNLALERDRLNRALEERNIEVEGLKRQINELRTSGNLRQSGVGNVKLDQLTLQVQSLLDENKRLSDLVVERTRETELLRSKLLQGDVRPSPVISTSGEQQQLLIVVAERDRLSRTLVEKNEDIEVLRRQVEELRAVNALQGIGQTGQVAGLIEENRRLSDSAEALRRRVTELETARPVLTSVPVQNQGQIAGLIEENRRLSDSVEALKRQGAVPVPVQGSSQEAQQLRDQINRLNSEKDGLNRLVTERLHEIDVLRRRITELETTRPVSTTISVPVQGSSQEAQQLRDQINRLNIEKDGLNRLLTERLHEIDVLRREIDGLRGGAGRVENLNIQISGLQEENKRLMDLLNERLKEIDLLKHKLFEQESLSGASSGLKDHVSILTGERDRLNQTLIERYNEIDGLKRRITDLETQIASSGSLKDQIARLNAEKESLNRLLTERLHEIDVLRREINDLRVNGGRTESLVAQVTSLTEENKRLERVVEEKTRKIGELEINGLTVNQLREQVNQLIQERDILNRRLSDNQREIDGYRRQLDESRVATLRIEQLTQQVTHLTEENRRIQDQLGAKLVENDELKRKILGLEANIASLKDDLSKKTVSLTHEVEALKLLLDDRTREGEALRNQLMELRSSSLENESLRAQVRGFGEENSRLNGIINELNRKVAEQEVSLREQQDLKTRVVLLGSEIERLEVVLGEKNKEIEELKVSYARLDQMANQILLLQDENKRNGELLTDRSRENESLKRRLVELEASETALNDLKIRLGLLSTENERLNSVVSERVKEADDLRRKLIELQSASIQLEHLTEENHRLQDLLSSRDNDIEQLRRRVSELERNPSGGSHGLKASLTVLTDEHQRVRDSLEIKNKEADEWRAKFFEAQKDLTQVSEFKVRIQALQGENDRLNGVVSDRFREIEDLKRKLADAQLHGGASGNIQVDELRAKLALVNQENDRLNSAIHDKIRELETLRLTYHSGAGSGSESPNFLVRDLQEKLRVLAQENEDLRKRSVMNSPQKSLTYDPSVEDLKIKVYMLTAENERLKGSPVKSQGGSGSVEELQARIAGLIAENERLERELEGMRRATSITVSPMKGADIESATTFRPQEATEKFKKTGAGVAGSLQSSPEKYGEVERLNRMLIEKENEIDRLRRSSVRGGDDQRVKDLEIRLEMTQREADRLNQALNEKTREETLRYQSSGSYTAEGERFRQECERLGRLLAEKQKEVDELTLKIGRMAASNTGSGIKVRVEDDYRKQLDENMNEYTKRYAIERQALEGEILGLRQKALDLEDKVRILSDDNQQLSIINEERLVDIETWKQRFEHLERQKITELESMRREYDERLKEEVERSMRLMKEGPEATITELRREKISLEERAFNLGREIEKLRDYLNSSVEEVEEWRGRYGELESLRAQEISELRKQFENFRKANVDLKEIQVKFAAERTAYETQILQLQQKVVDLENQVEMLLSENERITTLSLERLKEVELWRKKHGQSDEDYTLQVTELRNQLEMFKSNNYDVKQLAIKYSAERSADQSQIKQLKQMNENYKSELEKLYDLMGQRKNDFDSLAQQNEELRRLYDKATRQARDQGTESQDTKERLEFLERNIVELEQSREQYRKQAERNSVELTRKNKDLVDKIQELDILKMKYEEALANYQALNSRLFEKLTSDS